MENVDRQGQWHALAIGEAVGVCDRPAAGPDRACTALGDGDRTPDVPDIEQHQRSSGDVECPEELRPTPLMSLHVFSTGASDTDQELVVDFHKLHDEL